MIDALTYPTRTCPGCGSSRLAADWSMRSTPPAEQLPFSDLRASWRGFFKEQKRFFTYACCAECSQVYCGHFFTPTQLADLYGQMENNTGGQDETLMARAQRGYWEMLQRHVTLPAGAYVELGPDIGLFTREAMGHPAFDSFWMIEPNLAVHPALDHLLAAKTHTLLNDLEQIENIPDESVSLVVAVHVLDHLLDPQQLLERLARKLKSGGIIFAITHDQSSFVARLFGERWPAYCLQHPQLYSPRTLRQSYGRAGLQDVRIEGTTNYFPVGYLLQHFLFAARLGTIKVPLPASWSLGLKLGNMAAIGTKR